MFNYNRRDASLLQRTLANNINLTTPTRPHAPMELWEGILVAVGVACLLVTVVAWLVTP